MGNDDRQTKGTKWIISPWWENGDRAEIGDNAPSVLPGRSPIRYKAIWHREREEFGYNPRFLPNTVTFDRNNRPVIRVGVHDSVGKHATVYQKHIWVKEMYLQTLNADGKWIALPLHRVMKDNIPYWNDDMIFSGTFQPEERVVFDAAGDAYTIVKSKYHGDYLLHSRDEMENWDVHALPINVRDMKNVVYRIENTAKLRPPVIFALYESVDLFSRILWILAPRKKADGTLENLGLITVDTYTPSDGSHHSGVSDQTVTIGNKTHIVYIRLPVHQIGTPAYIVTYNHEDGSTIGPVPLGTSESESDGGIADHHNGPAIVDDRQGFLHVVLGAHGKPFIYRASAHPNFAISWKPPTMISSESAKETYVSLVIGPDDTLHLVSRVNEEEGKPLHYMRKKGNANDWSDFGQLVVPKPNLGTTEYSLWNQKLTTDRHGRLFLTYFYLAHKLKEDELCDYRTKWPNEELEWNEKDKFWETNAHDPVILMSSDSGYSWKIATTPDFYTAWDWVTVNSPAWSDAKGWHKAAYYSTIQTAVVNNTLYLLGRGEAGMHLWQFTPETNSWTKVATNTDLSDAEGWDDVTNYSTIQTAVANGVLYLIARGNRGMLTWELEGNRWTLLEEAENDPELSDAQGWKDVENYSTIQTAVVGKMLYLLARGNEGLWTWRFNPASKKWEKLAERDPELADTKGWADPDHYSTIQTAVVGGVLYLLARGGDGMQTWRFEPDNENSHWIRVVKDSPDWSDSKGWNDVANYSTIQTAVVNNTLYLLARRDDGMQMWRFEPDNVNPKWICLVTESPDLSDAQGWDDVAYYSTIQAAVFQGDLYLLARGKKGIYTWKFYSEQNTWARLAASNPGWSDPSGWGDSRNYTTIQTATTSEALYLLARANAGMHTWKFNRSP